MKQSFSNFKAAFKAALADKCLVSAQVIGVEPDTIIVSFGTSPAYGRSSSLQFLRTAFDREKIMLSTNFELFAVLADPERVNAEF
jgi:hypothetical protein